MVASDSCKELFLVEAIVAPIFELRIMTMHKNRNDTLPSRISETIDTVINIECNISSTNISSYCHMRQILGFIMINSSFKEHVSVANRQVSLRMNVRNNNDGSRSFVTLFEILLLEGAGDLI